MQGYGVDRDMKLYTPLRQDRVLALAGQPVPRVLAHGRACWLLNSVRFVAPKRSRWRGATFATIRSTFVKLGRRIEEFKSRMRLSFSAHLATPATSPSSPPDFARTGAQAP
jgi:hypothetical protein